MSTSRRAWFALAFLLAATTALGATKTWTGAGGDSLWSNGANWSGGVAPVNGDDVVVSGSTNNDIASLSLSSITQSNSGTLSGVQVSVGAGGLTFSPNNTTITATLTMPVKLTASQTWGLGGCGVSSITINGDITGSGSLILNTIDLGTGAGTPNVVINGHIANSGAVEFHATNFTLNNSNSFTGTMSIFSGGQLCSSTGPAQGVVTLGAAGAIPSGVPLFMNDGNAPHLIIGSFAVSVASLSTTDPAVHGNAYITLNGGSLTITNAPSTTSAAAIGGTGTVTMAGGTQTFTYPAGSLNPLFRTFSGAYVVNGGTLTMEANGSPGTPKPTLTINGGRARVKLIAFSDIAVNGGAIEPYNVLTGFSSAPISDFGNFTLTSAATYTLSLLPLGSFETSGTVTLGNAALVPINPPPSGNVGDTTTLIKNDANTPVVGTFAGLPEGSTFTAGTITYRITYHGGAGNDVQIVVAAAATLTTLNSSMNPSNGGDMVTLTATVTSTSGIPSGTVTFLDGAMSLGTSSLDGSGHATLTTSWQSAGTRSLTAAYGGSSSFAASTSAPLSQVVSNSVTSTNLSVSPNPAEIGSPVSIVATVHSPGGIATGTVNFFDGHTLIGSATIDSTGRARLTTSSLTVGTHALTATYLGTSTFRTSTSSAVLEMVTSAEPTVTSLSSSPNDSNLGQQVTLTATVHATTSVPTGMVTFNDGSTVLGSAPISSDQSATLTISTLTAGAHTLTAFFQGNDTLAPSTSEPIIQVVRPASPCAPTIVAGPASVTVPMHTTTTLGVTTTSDLPQTMQWFVGIFPDASQPASQVASMQLDDVTETTNVWVLISNSCGATHASATVAVIGPRRRAILHP
jgi:hypothetical protein